MRTFKIAVAGETPTEISYALERARELIERGSLVGEGTWRAATFSFDSTGEWKLDERTISYAKTELRLALIEMDAFYEESPEVSLDMLGSADEVARRLTHDSGSCRRLAEILTDYAKDLLTSNGARIDALSQSILNWDREDVTQLARMLAELDRLTASDFADKVDLARIPTAAGFSRTSGIIAVDTSGRGLLSYQPPTFTP